MIHWNNHVILWNLGAWRVISHRVGNYTVWHTRSSVVQAVLLPWTMPKTGLSTSDWVQCLRWYTQGEYSFGQGEHPAKGPCWYKVDKIKKYPHLNIHLTSISLSIVHPYRWPVYVWFESTSTGKFFEPVSPWEEYPAILSATRTVHWELFGVEYLCWQSGMQFVHRGYCYSDWQGIWGLQRWWLSEADPNPCWWCWWGSTDCACTISKWQWEWLRGRGEVWLLLCDNLFTYYIISAQEGMEVDSGVNDSRGIPGWDKLKR